MTFEIDRKSYSLRPMTLDDLTSVLEIEKTAYPKPWTRAQFEEELTKSFSNPLVLTDDDGDSEIAAYIVYWTMFEETHLLNVTVAEPFRGLGVAKRLIRQMIDQGLKRGCKQVILEVRVGNTAAVELYQKLGFFIDHVKKGFYSDGTDAYFMRLFLNRKNDF